MANIESLYTLFDVPKTCTDNELRNSFRKLISDVHPDRNPHLIEATHRTQEIIAAYQELKHHRLKLQQRSDNCNNKSSGITFKFEFSSGVDLNDVDKRKAAFRQNWESFRDNEADPIYALLLIHAGFQAERHDTVKNLLLNPILIDIASLLLSHVESYSASATLLRWAEFLGKSERSTEGLQILEDAFATGGGMHFVSSGRITAETLRSWHYDLAQRTDPTTGLKAPPEVRIAHLSRILELGFTFGYIYKLLAEAYHNLGDDEQARGFLNKAYDVDPNVLGAVRISRALGLVGKSARPSEAAPSNRSKLTRPEQIPSQTQIYEWVEKKSWDTVISFANPNDYSPRILSKARDALRMIASSLADCTDAHSVESLIRLLHLDWYWDVNQAAAISLSKIGDESTLSVLSEFSLRECPGKSRQNVNNRAKYVACVSYLRSRINAHCSLSTNERVSLAHAENAFYRNDYGRSRFLLEKILADTGPTHPSYLKTTVLLARSCAEMNDCFTAIRIISQIINILPNVSRKEVISDIGCWLQKALACEQYIPIYDQSFKLALNIQLELTLSAKTPDDVLRPLRSLARWLEKLGVTNTVQLIRQLIRTEAPGTRYVDKDNRMRNISGVVPSEDMRRFLIDFDTRIMSEAFANLKRVMRSQRSV